ncbi:hypothetical protein [Actinomycetospora chibensis]|uniref:Uncharacterized protein n=1 Tax=Actinomycetospora chibensis TaxID=663606 RepID=A0ABV9RKG3_9PSEU|nr:hypothetical protein [Actinomycetospora chibensis]MDD7926575.1 hypothetical protein [Actinomycetospora chibensis]
MSIDSVAHPVVVPLVGRPPSTGPATEPPAAGAWAPGVERCRPDRRTRIHHDRLLRVEDDPDEVIELLELAVTWGELDYSESDVVPPEAWIDFAAGHRWRHPERVLRLFSVAADVALRGPHLAPDHVPAPCTGVDAVRRDLAASDLLAGEL